MSSPPPPPSAPRHRHHFTATQILPALVASTVTVSVLLLLFLFLWRRLRQPSVSKSLSSSSSSYLPRRFSYPALRRATASFSPSRRLGQGGFGAVYSGTLTLNSKKKLSVAIKVMDAGSLQGEREFQNEVFLADKLVDSDRVVKLLGFAYSRKRRHMCLVYELMPNGNLQDCLLQKKLDELMDWSNRFRIAIEVARALAYLHHHCNPPVIHGDVKPSNVLLDANFSAKIGDFGLARLKLVDHKNDDCDEVVVNITENGVVVDHSNNVGVGVDDNGSVLETESLSTTVGLEEGSAGVDQSPVKMVLLVESSPEMVTALASPSEFLDKGSDLEGQLDGISVENGGKEVGKVGIGNRNGNGKDALGKESLQKQENRGGFGSGKVKDYVMEWIGKEVGKERPNGDWIGGATSSSSLVTGRAEKKAKKKLEEWWVSMEDGKSSKKEKRKPVREWWKDKYSEELAGKKKKKKSKKHRVAMSDSEENWWPRDEEMYADSGKKRRTWGRMGSKNSVDWWLDGFSGDLWKARQTGYDSASGEIPASGVISSTASMRGTVCYVAPEHSIGGDLSEKCDVYSFGVLLLVLIAGRRPLQVTGSPMSEFHRANLLSWARQLARAGKLLDLVDKSIRSLNKEQAQLCIIVALVCLQKSPASRPSMKEVVGMLTGELDPPQLPLEYRSFKSRKKLR